MRLSFLLLLPLMLFGLEGELRVHVKEKERYLVSEKIVLKLHIMSTGFSIMDVDVGADSNDDFIIIAPRSASYVLSENYKAKTWQSSVYEYELYPLRSGTLDVPGMRVRFSASSGYGQPKKSFDLQTDPLRLHVNAPKGIDGFVLSTSKLSLDVKYEPQPKQLHIGDAFSREVVVQAQNVPDLLLPSLSSKENPYFRTYRDEPVLTQKEGMAKRIEKEHYVAQKEGNVTFEVQRVYWYDVANDALHVNEIPALHIVVLAPPAQVDTKASYYFVFLLSGFATSIALLIYFWRFRHQSQDEKRLKALERACSGGSAVRIYNAYIRYRALSKNELNIDISNLSQAAAKGEKNIPCKKLMEAIYSQKVSLRKRRSGLVKSINPKS